MDTQEIFAFGAIKSPEDYRYINLEHIAGAAPVTFPDSYHIEYTAVPDVYQRKIGACTAHTPAEVAMHRVQRLGGSLKRYSPRFLYAMSKITDGIPASEGDCGTYCVQPFKVAMQYGIATEDTCPNDTTLSFDSYIYNRDPDNVGSAVFADADANRIFPGYVQVGKSGNVQLSDLKHGLMSGLDGVSLTLPVGAEWWTKADGTGSWASSDILPIRKMVVEVSGHAITITGWEDESGTGRTKIFFRNHWSTAWADGDNGWFYFDDHSGIIEAWMPSEIPDALLAIVKSLPARANFTPEFTTDIEIGAKGTDVQNLQITLKILGAFPFNQSVTSFFGPITAKAVMDFQKEYNVADAATIAAAGGRVGPLTRTTLNNLMARK